MIRLGMAASQRKAKIFGNFRIKWKMQCDVTLIRAGLRAK
jgi:hypothetical protein